MADLTLTVTKTINAPIEKVFDAWLDAQTLAKFMLPAPGMPEPETETNPVEGGNFTIIMQVGDAKIPHTGKYLEISRPNKLVFTWESPVSADNSTVTLNFTAIGERSTNIELTHTKFIDEQTRSNHEGGWGRILESQKQLLE